jgi:hypothetical protein
LACAFLAFVGIVESMVGNLSFGSDPFLELTLSGALRKWDADFIARGAFNIDQSFLWILASSFGSININCKYFNTYCLLEF